MDTTGHGKSASGPAHIHVLAVAGCQQKPNQRQGHGKSASGPAHPHVRAVAGCQWHKISNVTVLDEVYEKLVAYSTLYLYTYIQSHTHTHTYIRRGC